MGVAASLVMLMFVVSLRKVATALMWMFVLIMFVLMMLMVMVVSVMIVRTASSMFMFLHLWRTSMVMPARSMLIMMMFLCMYCPMVVRAIMVSSSNLVTMQHIHDKQVAAQPNERC